VTSNAAQLPDVSSILVNRWQAAADKLDALAAALPADLFDFRPVEGVRSIAELVRHAAFWNDYLARTIRGEHPDGTLNEWPADTYPTRDAMLRALANSSADVSRALSADPARAADLAETIVGFIEHTCEHYGQLVVYARLNGVVPPASRA
jgi:uncharacterized damage-inducible protein DinB